MIAAMLNLTVLEQSILIVVIETDNFERMKDGDPITLESVLKGGILPPPSFPLNFSTLIAYEPDTAELYIKAQGEPLAFLQWLERGRVFIEGVDGSEHTVRLRRGDAKKTAN